MAASDPRCLPATGQATTSPGWTAILLAGQRPGGDPLASHFGRESKALIPVAGEVMLSRVLRTLLATPGITRVIPLAQNIEQLMSAPEMGDWAHGDPRVTPMVSGRTISGSILSVVRRADVRWPVFVTTADNVLLTPAIATEFLTAAASAQLAVGLAARHSVEEGYGPSERSWLRFRDGDYTGANLFALQSPAVAQALAFWERVEEDRKHMWKLAARFGPRLLCKVLLRRLTLHDAIAEAGQRLDVIARPVVLSDGRAGIDVDKPSDHRLAEAILTA